MFLCGHDCIGATYQQVNMVGLHAETQMTAEYFLCDDGGGDSIGTWSSISPESQELDKTIAKTCHFFCQFQGGNSAHQVEFDNGDIAKVA